MFVSENVPVSRKAAGKIIEGDGKSPIVQFLDRVQRTQFATKKINAVLEDIASALEKAGSMLPIGFGSSEIAERSA